MRYSQKMQSIPDWLKVNVNVNKMRRLNDLFNLHGIETICWNADCPNICECYENHTATFLLMGNICSRNCAFCGVTKGTPKPLDYNEINRIKKAISNLNISYVVLTTVTRDDLPDGGAYYLRDIINALNDEKLLVEALIPDFNGNTYLLDQIISASPAVLGHNLETVRKLYPIVRPLANYDDSLKVLKYIKEKNTNILTKSSILLGLGESIADIDKVICDLVSVNLDILIVCQYLRPSKKQLEVKEYVTLDTFELIKEKAINAGIKYIVSKPLARTSYKAFEIYKKLKGGDCYEIER
jgi:lipoic acid synthetase